MDKNELIGLVESMVLEASKASSDGRILDALQLSEAALKASNAVAFILGNRLYSGEYNNEVD